MTNVANVVSPLDSTPDRVMANVSLARDSLIASRDSAAKAAAHAYQVWKDVASPLAHSDMREWFKGEVEKVNLAIDRHNDAEKALKTRVSHFKAGTLSKGDALFVVPRTPAEQAAIDADRANLAQLATLEKSDWERRRKVRLDAGGEAAVSQFLLVAKFVLNLDKRSQASLASRYAKVMEWIDARFSADNTAGADDIVNAIKSAGGFDEVLDVSRGNNGGDASEEAEEREITNSALVEQAKGVVLSAPGKAEIVLDSLADREGIVALVGRCVGGKVQVLGALDIEAAALDRTLLNFNDSSLLPSKPRAEFMSRVLRLGDLVHTGEKTDKKLNDLTAGKTLKSERVLSIIPDGTMGTSIVVSARYADASVIVTATPVTSECAFEGVTAPVILDSTQLKQLAKALAERASSRLIDVDLRHQEGVASFVVTNAALVAKKHNGGVKTLVLLDVAELAHKPLVVDGFRAQVSGNVTRDQLLALYKGGLADWKPDAAKAAQKVAQLCFSNGKITYKLPGQPEVVISCDLQMPGTDALKLRTKDLHDVIQAVLNEDASSLTLGADTGGMLRIGWSDRFGNYKVYLPTATSSGELSSRRLEPMRITASARAA